MIYGHKTTYNGRLVTLIVAAKSFSEYEDFNTKAVKSKNYEDHFISDLLQHMMDETFNGFKRPVDVYYHSTEEQRDAFISENSVRETQSYDARDKQEDMIFNEKHEKLSVEKEQIIRGEEEAERTGMDYVGRRYPTLAEELGLDKHDPWDKSKTGDTDKDKEIKEQMKRAQASGLITKESFGISTKDENDKSNPDLKIISGDAIIGPDGKVNIDNIKALKFNGEVDQELKQERDAAEQKNLEDKLAGRKTFDPSDFSAILGGNVPGKINSANLPTKTSVPTIPRKEEITEDTVSEQTITIDDPNGDIKEEVLEEGTDSNEFTSIILIGTYTEVESLPQEVQDIIDTAYDDETPDQIEVVEYNAPINGLYFIPNAYERESVEDTIGVDDLGSIVFAKAYTSVFKKTEEVGWVLMMRDPDLKNNNFTLIKLV